MRMATPVSWSRGLDDGGHVLSLLALLEVAGRQEAVHGEAPDVEVCIHVPHLLHTCPGVVVAAVTEVDEMAVRPTWAMLTPSTAR
uniref:Uncharacterized protein n=1 Tax=Oryza brachyantha TaxID=4533 RepID=J3LW93_ORYBR